MTERPTQPVVLGDANPQAAVRFWERRTMPPFLADRWRSLTGPWGRLYAAIAVGLTFVYRPTTWGALAGICLLTMIASFGRRHWLWYAASPIGAVWVGTGRLDWAAATTGVLIAGHRFTSRRDRPDALAERLHLRIARETDAPTKERYWRMETYAEARDRILTFMRGAKVVSRPGNPFKRIRKEEWRPLDPVREKWLRIDYNPPDATYPIGGLWIRYPASARDDDPDWQQRVLHAAASKLPPYPDGTQPLLMAAWQTDADQATLTVARPLPAWVELQDLPTLPWADVIPFGLTTPDNPAAILLEGDDTTAVACWNPDNVSAPIPLAPNILLAGPPGAYKTSVLRTLIHGARENLGEDGAHITAIDGKGEGAFAYLHGQHDCIEVTDPAQAKAELGRAWTEMKARYALNDARRRAEPPEPLFQFQPRVIVIDEGMSLLDALSDDPSIDQLMVQITDLFRLGRLGRVFGIWSTQRPDVKGVSKYGTIGQMRDMLELRIAGPGLSDDGARMVFGQGNSHLAKAIPKTPRARLGMLLGNTFALVQLAYTPDPKGADPDQPGPYVHSALDYTAANQEPVTKDPAGKDDTAELTVVRDIGSSRRGRQVTP